MKELNVTIVNNLPYDARLFADGKQVLLKTNKRGVSEFKVATDNDVVELRAENYSAGKLSFGVWLFWTFICWLVSCFGIFDSVPNKKGRAVEAVIRVSLDKSAFVKLKFNLFKKDGAAMEVVASDTQVDEITNRYYVDIEALKRNKAYKIWRIASVVAVVAATLFVIITRG